MYVKVTEYNFRSRHLMANGKIYKYLFYTFDFHWGTNWASESNSQTNSHTETNKLIAIGDRNRASLPKKTRFLRLLPGFVWAGYVGEKENNWMRIGNTSPIDEISSSDHKFCVILPHSKY